MADNDQYHPTSISDDTPGDEVLEGECISVEEEVMEEDEVQEEDVIMYDEVECYNDSSPEPQPPVVVSKPITKQSTPTIRKQSTLHALLLAGNKTLGGNVNKSTTAAVNTQHVSLLVGNPTRAVTSNKPTPALTSPPTGIYRMIAPKITTIPVAATPNSGSVIVLSSQSSAGIQPGNSSNFQGSVVGKMPTCPVIVMKAPPPPPLVIKDIRQCKAYATDSLKNLKIKLDYVDRMLKAQQTLLGKLRGRSLFLSKDNYRLKKSIAELKWIVSEQNAQTTASTAVATTSDEDDQPGVMLSDDNNEQCETSADAPSLYITAESVTDE